MGNFTLHDVLVKYSLLDNSKLYYLLQNLHTEEMYALFTSELDWTDAFHAL